MTKHRVPLLGSGLRRHTDPQHARDPRIRAVVAQLQRMPAEAVAPPPRAHFRAELRAQLVAVAPRIVAEGTAEAAPEAITGAQEQAGGAGQPPQHRFFGRRLGVAGAVIAVCLVLFGGVVWESQKALPGDALYGLKRAGEDVRLAMAGSDTGRAKDYLGFAGTRVDEAQALVRRAVPAASGPGASGRLSATTAALVRSTLGSADADVRAASRLLTAQAAQSKSSAPLATMRHWAPQQLRRLHRLQRMLPAGALRQRAEKSATLVRRADARATALRHSIRRGCPPRTGTDSLGIEPCSAPKHGPQQRPHSARAARRHHARTGTHRPGGSGGSHRTAGSGATRPGSSRRGHTRHASGAPKRTSLPTPGLPSLPSLPLPTSSLPNPLPTSSLPNPLPTSSLRNPLPRSPLPISVGRCGVSLPLGVRLGHCPSH